MYLLILFSFLCIAIALVIAYYLSINSGFDEIITYENAENVRKKGRLDSFSMDKLLTEDQVDTFVARIKNIKQHWKHKNVVMDIIGTASYIEGAVDFATYTDSYLQTNKILEDHFSDLLDIVLHYFKKRVPECNVEYMFAFPGFHIFTCGRIFSLPVASIHKDLQYKNLVLNENEDFDVKKTLSFTLCLELPPTGGGLIIFEEDKKKKVEYKAGYIVCHNGKTTHMIAPSPIPSGNMDHYRITLQGHGLYERTKNTWYLYW
jgi:hypothetical protein